VLIFCIFIIPVFSVFWRKIRPVAGEDGANDALYEKICALGAGSVCAFVRFFNANFISGGGFGLSRYISAFIDYTGPPLIIPVIVCAVFHKVRQKFYQRELSPDWTGFVLASLIPLVLVSAIRWGTEKDPILLVLTPLLWTAGAVIFCPLFNFMMKKRSKFAFILGLSGIAAVPLFAAAVFWQFFMQENQIGFGILGIFLAPAIIVICTSLRWKRKNVHP
jgi:hypothetical protein